jgi:hypothetical protein
VCSWCVAVCFPPLQMYTLCPSSTPFTRHRLADGTKKNNGN